MKRKKWETGGKREGGREGLRGLERALEIKNTKE